MTAAWEPKGKLPKQQSSSHVSQSRLQPMAMAMSTKATNATTISLQPMATLDNWTCVAQTLGKCQASKVGAAGQDVEGRSNGKKARRPG